MKKYFAILAVMGFVQVTYGQNNSKVLTYAEQMPEPRMNLIKYLSEHVHYPDSAINNNIEGRVSVRFIVTAGGGIDSVKTVGSKHYGYGLEEEAIRVIKDMPDGFWSPGKQNGEFVNVYYVQPIVFKLKTDSVSQPVFKYVEQMPEPTFNILEFLSTHVEYPNEALNKDIQGRVLVKFIVNENGTLDSVHTIGQAYGGGLEEEAIRVIKAMPPWKPGRQNGKPVKVYFTQPISFQLDNSAIRPTNAAGH